LTRRSASCWRWRSWQPEGTPTRSASAGASELDETFHFAHFNLSFARGDIEKAPAAAEKAYSLAPWARATSGLVAELLKLTGDSARADSILQKMGDGTANGATLGFTYYHLLCSEIERAAEWAEKLIEQREPMLLFLVMFPLGKDLRRNSRWPALSKILNLP